MNTTTKTETFKSQVANRVEELNEEIESMKVSLGMVKSQAARDAIQAKLEHAEKNRRLLRGF